MHDTIAHTDLAAATGAAILDLLVPYQRVTNLDRIRSYLAQYGHGTTRELATQFGWPIPTAANQISRALTYGHIEIAGRQRSAKSAKHYEFIYRLKTPRVVRS